MCYNNVDLQPHAHLRTYGSCVSPWQKPPSPSTRAVVAMATTADIFKTKENGLIGNWRELSMSKYNIRTREI